MEKRLIILILAPLLLFFNWFDPVVKENEKGEKAYNNKKYKEALNHFRTARNILSSSDGFKSNITQMIDNLDDMLAYLKSINAESLNVSDLNEKHKKQIIGGFANLSKSLNTFYKLVSVYSDKIKDNEIKNISHKILKNIDNLNSKIRENFATKGAGNIGLVFKDVVYTKSQIEQFNSKIEVSIKDVKTSPDLESLRYNIASSLYELGNYKNAKNEFEKINLDKSNIKRSDLFFDLGNTNFKMKDYQSALDLYKKALRENPNDIEARQNYELTLEMIKKQKKENKDNKDKNKDKKKDKKDKKDNKDKDKNKKNKDNKEQKKEKKNKEKKDKKDENKKKEDKQKKPEDKKDKKDKQDKKKEQQQKEDKKKKQEKPKAKPEEKHKNMLRFIDQNEKKQMKKMLQKNKLLKYGIRKSKKKRKDW